MVKIVKTKVKFFSPITIYDTEIINDISVPDSSYWDYQKGDICVAGFLIGNEITQIVHEHNNDTEEFKNELKKILDSKKDIYAFNYLFEHGVTEGLLKQKYFISEIKSFKGRGFSKSKFFEELIKDKIINKEDIPVDPLNDDGNLCIQKWKEGKVDDILGHNRSCLIKEYYLFMNKEYLYNKYKKNINKQGWYTENDI